ncbi:MAG: hypothetical protein COA45_10490 [Zetaproteobacteria bacterium]|nr:MAG: hypothetical protein COA45_10490 [Zetaproteobacteria bacterium]
MRRKMVNRYTEKGNALVYVLIAIVLFAALSFTLSRNMSGSNTKEIDNARAALYAVELIGYSAQVKSIIDQMSFTGTKTNNLNFTKPGEAGFNTAPHIHKIFHPEGGGLTPTNLPNRIIKEISTNPKANWYLGNFNHVEWTKSTATDIILTAHQITRPVCQALNKEITGDTVIPALSGNLSDYLVDTGTNTDLTTVSCVACEGYSALCVSNNTITAYSFYTIIINR